MDDRLNRLFEMLDRWRHLPSYQLERRADVFFGLYLREMLEDLLDLELHETLVPEFPIKRDLIWPERPTAKSVKVDYVTFARDRSRCLLVELKTDAGSRRDAQDEYLEQAQQIGLRRILEGLKGIVQRTSAHQKYFCLLEMLAAVGCLRIPNGYDDFVYPQGQPGLRGIQREIEVTVDDGEFELDVVYIQPLAPASSSHRVVDFAEMSEWLRGRDPLADLFADHLLRWRDPAGWPADAGVPSRDPYAESGSDVVELSS